MKIPVIDLAKIGLLVPSDENVSVEDYKTVGDDLYKALSEVGFAYLKNFGIAEADLEKAHAKFQEFFDLDLETKSKFNFAKEACGYFGIGTENLQYGVKDYKEVFNTSGVFWSNADRMSPEKLVDNFNEETKDFADVCKKLTLRLFTALSYGMKLKDVNFLASRHTRINDHDNHTTLRSTLYPPITDDVDYKLRLGAHSDVGTFTLLFQDDNGGLQVETQPGEFIDAPPIPGTIVMNIGDIMNMWTEGRLKSTIHRVTIPDDKATRLRHRRSMAYFVHADDEVPIETMEYLPGADPPMPERRLFDPKNGPKTALDWGFHIFYKMHNIENK